MRKKRKAVTEEKIGQHIFHNADFFNGIEKYTLEPLRSDGKASLVCIDVDGIDWIKLKEVHFFRGGANSEIEIRKADDIFACYAKRNVSFPTRPRIIKASFHVKFTGTKTPRTVVVRSPNNAQYTRDSDAKIIEEFFERRGFALTKQEQVFESVF